MDIVALIDAELAQLHQARAALTASNGEGIPSLVRRGPGRPAKNHTLTAPVAQVRKKRKMSPEGRKRIIAAVKARWAKQKAAGK